MPRQSHSAAANRDSKLFRIRKLSLWITGGAAAASLGLGSAFAHALPGHKYTVSTTTTSPGGAAGPAPTGSNTSTASNTKTSSRRHQGLVSHLPVVGRSHQSSKLAQPKRKPAAAPAPAQTSAAPVVSSGGS
jgi:hypothetical protein